MEDVAYNSDSSCVKTVNTPAYLSLFKLCIAVEHNTINFLGLEHFIRVNGEETVEKSAMK